MAGELKNRRKFTNSLKNELYDELDRLSKETEISKSKLLDRAVTMLIDYYSTSKKKT